MRKFQFLLATILILAGCSSIRVIKYQSLGNEDYSNSHLRDFFRATPNPKIVLRVPNTNDKATSNTINTQNNNVLYNAIEKEFLREGFSVRDRGLFNEIIDKSQSTDYAKIGQETDTDLILEVVNINTNVAYSTNKVTIVKKSGNTDEIQPIDYKRSGASVEFRLILVRNNEIAGNYKFNYTPCADGCPLTDWAYNRHNKQLELRETVATNPLEEFITACTKDLIKSIRS